uniref:Uncharacterized protein n=1 Tax=Anguilla anguilla TaxID=7936 RepID=A0A0E9RRW2_ANGAN
MFGEEMYLSVSQLVTFCFLFAF